MRILEKNSKNVKKFQMGGPVDGGAPVEGGAPAGPEGAPAEGGEDPMMQILQVAAQAVQANNCEAAMAVCQALMQIAQGGAQGAPAEEPTFARNGAKLTRVR